jgi:hypothetical protein
MEQHDLIHIEKCCAHYKIEYTFIDALENIGLIEIQTIEQVKLIHQDTIGDLKKMIRLHHELNVTAEGIDVFLNLLEKEVQLHQEVIRLKNKLRLYESD